MFFDVFNELKLIYVLTATVGIASVSFIIDLAYFCLITLNVTAVKRNCATLDLVTYSVGRVAKFGNNFVWRVLVFDSGLNYYAFLVRPF